MKYKKLKRLNPRARKFFRLDSFLEGPAQSIRPYIIDNVSGDRDIYPMIATVQKAMGLHPDNRSESDSWLGPRIHAALRIHRADAADMSIWDYLTFAVDELREYIFWRWADSGTNTIHPSRVFSRRRHAFMRLWWVAEMMRNGSDYSPAVEALRNQDMIDQYMVRDFFHNRPAALAFVQVIGGIDKSVKDRRNIERKLALNFDHILTTYVIDETADDQGPDMAAYTNWMNEDVNEAILLAEDPIGPNETPVDERKIATVKEVLENLLAELLPDE